MSLAEEPFVAGRLEYPDAILDNSNLRRLSGNYVVYMPTQAFRANYNAALELSALIANERDEPLLIAILSTPDCFDASLTRRQAVFIQGCLADMQLTCLERGIRVLFLNNYQSLSSLIEGASICVTDKPYLTNHRYLAVRLAELAPVVTVDHNRLVPSSEFGHKQFLSESIFIERCFKYLPAYLELPPMVSLNNSSVKFRLPGVLHIPLSQTFSFVDLSVKPAYSFPGGYGAALERLDAFLLQLKDYEDCQFNPTAGATSKLGPYLAWGAISPLCVLLRVREAGQTENLCTRAFEESLLKRDAAFNFVLNCETYDKFAALPLFARESLQSCNRDRKFSFTLKEFEEAATSDRLFNAIQRMIVSDGWVPHILRAYWAKAILYKASCCEKALDICLTLNNRYSLDGFNPSSFYCVSKMFGLRDHACRHHPVFGHVRTLTQTQLLQHFSVPEFLDSIRGKYEPEEASPMQFAGIGQL